MVSFKSMISIIVAAAAFTSLVSAVPTPETSNSFNVLLNVLLVAYQYFAALPGGDSNASIGATKRCLQLTALST